AAGQPGRAALDPGGGRARRPDPPRDPARGGGVVVDTALGTGARGARAALGVRGLVHGGGRARGGRGRGHGGGAGERAPSLPAPEEPARRSLRAVRGGARAGPRACGGPLGGRGAARRLVRAGWHGGGGVARRPPA